MVSKKNILWAILSLIGGVVSALLLFRVLAVAPLDNTNPLLQTLGVRKPVVIGFTPYWLLTKVEPGSLDILDTVTYFSLSISEDGTLLRRNNPQEAEPGWRSLELGRFAELIQGKPSSQLKRSLLVHLANEEMITELLSNPKQHAVNLVNDAEPLMRQHEFTDLNIDIESFRIASPSAQADMSDFLREVKQQLTSRNLGTLTTEIAVGSLVREYVLKPEDVGAISDYVVLMAYDFYYSGSPITGPVAPIGGAKDKWQYDVTESVKLATQAIPAEKLILGIPTYGYEWETLLATPGSAVIPNTNKTVATRKVAEILASCTECIKGRDAASGTPYLILPPTEGSAYQQIYYEDVTSIKQKIELAKAYNLGGVAIWALGYEDAALLAPIREYRTTSLESN